MKPVHVCPMCKCEKRRSRSKKAADVEAARRAQQLVKELVVRYGSMRRAGRAYSERYGLKQDSGEMQFRRIMRGAQNVSYYALDRIEVFSAS